MNIGAASIFIVILVLGLFVNKYVLSVLGFKYPTIFQGWQTLCGLLLYKILTVASKSNFKVTPIDRPALISLLPGFLFFTTSLIASSKALAGVPIPVYVSVLNSLPAAVYLLDRLAPSGSQGRPPSSPLQLACSCIALSTSTVLVLSQVGLDFSDSAYFWLVVAVVTSGAYCLHCRIADARYSSWDRLYYTSLFSVVVLAPASFYLEEAFEALKFHHDKQELFIVGCLASACLGAVSSLHGVRLRQDEYFGQVVHLAQALAVLLSPLLFPANLAGWQWAVVATNVLSALPVPSHLSKDDEEANLPSIIESFESFTA